MTGGSAFLPDLTVGGILRKTMKQTELKRRTPLRTKKRLNTRKPLISRKRIRPITPKQIAHKEKVNQIADEIFAVNMRCAVCNAIGSRNPRWNGTFYFYLDPHHVLPVSQGGKDTKDNIILVHRECHDRIHNNPEYSKSQGWLK